MMPWRRTSCGELPCLGQLDAPGAVSALANPQHILHPLSVCGKSAAAIRDACPCPYCPLPCSKVIEESMGDAMDEEKERRQQLAGVSCSGADAVGMHVHLLCIGRFVPRAAGHSPDATQLHAQATNCTLPLSISLPFSLQVRKEARAAIQRERDQQIALMIAK